MENQRLDKVFGHVKDIMEVCATFNALLKTSHVELVYRIDRSYYRVRNVRPIDRYFMGVTLKEFPEDNLFLNPIERPLLVYFDEPKDIFDEDEIDTDTNISAI